MRIWTRLQRLGQRAWAGRVKPPEERPAAGFSATQITVLRTGFYWGLPEGLPTEPVGNHANSVRRTPGPPKYPRLQLASISTVPNPVNKSDPPWSG
jgi:hypothetical protein